MARHIVPFLLLCLLMLGGTVGSVWSRDFTPSVFNVVVGLGLAVVVFLAAKGCMRASDSQHNPATLAFFAAIIAQVVWIFPVGKALTAITGSSVQVAGVVTGYHERTGRSRGKCRSEIEVGLSNGTSVQICGPRLPSGLDLHIQIKRSVFGRYSEQRLGQIDIDGIGSLDTVVQKAEEAQRAGDEAAAHASRINR